MQPLNTVFCGGETPRTGYGFSELALHCELLRAGIPVNSVKPAVPESKAAIEQYLTLHHITTTPILNGHAPAACLVTAIPGYGALYGGRLPQFLMTMSESTRVSDKWVAAINRYFKGVFVPAPGLVDIYYRSGVEVPVYYVPLGVDYYPPPPIQPDRPVTRRYLTYSLGDARKGADAALFAFKNVFRDDPAYQLIIKTKQVKGTWLQGCRERNVQFVEGELSEADWFALLQSVDAFIFASRGEGFGLPPREAALVGTPALATNWLGMWDVAEWGFPVAVKEYRQALFTEEEANHHEGLWVEPDIADIDQQLAWVAQYPHSARLHAANGRDYLLKHFTWQQTVEQMIGIMKL